MRKHVGGLAVAVIVAGLASAASAATFQYGFGANNATADAAPADGMAQVEFTLDGANLKVTLTNVSSAVTGNGAELTAVYWNSDANSGTFTSVALNAGSSVLFGGASYTSGSHLNGDATNGGAGWYAYGNSVGLDSGQQYALSAAGLNLGYTSPFLSLLGEVSTDPTAPVNAYSPNSPNGPAGGLVGSGGAAANLSKFAVVDNSLVFTISGVGAGFDLESIGDVQFQYTTTRANAVPIPAAAWMGLSGLAGMGLIRLRRKFRGA
jgi:hypothetical protein